MAKKARPRDVIAAAIAGEDEKPGLFARNVAQRVLWAIEAAGFVIVANAACDSDD